MMTYYVTDLYPTNWAERYQLRQQGKLPYLLVGDMIYEYKMKKDHGN